MKRIYIAGPMTGYHQYNFTAFLEAEKEIKAKGWEVISPATMMIAQGFNPITSSTAIFTDDMLLPAIKMDINAVLYCDAIAMLDGWSESKGAKAEFYVARWAGKQLFRYYQKAGHLFTISHK